jgi:ParB family transcriptional regulator, chromosome partitioning protein
MSSSPPFAALDGLSDATLVPLSLIDDAPGQPRQQLPDVEDLASNIKAFGLLQPVALRKVGGRYQLVSGHRRVAAYRWLLAHYPASPQWSAIHAVVTRSSDDLAHLALISGQVHVQPWTDVEVHQVLQRLRSTGMNQAGIARALHRTDAWVSRNLRVYNDAAIAPVVESGELAASVAGEILSLPDPSERAQLAQAAARQKWSQQRTRREVRARTTFHDISETAEIRELRRIVRELLVLTQRVKPEQIPPDALADLKALRVQIDRAMSRPVDTAA